ncbi:Patatin [Granulicella tundricola MP5ACTX9]|uniref:Patatin n=2 Tax=Granulicella TaxID=940557 RepID=E8WXD4_GRATM|nr:Patatin [Granulicella tundricola MP5ACTX9]
MVFGLASACFAQSGGAGAVQGGAPGGKNAGDQQHVNQSQAPDTKTASGSDTKDYASGRTVKVSPLAPASAPAKVFARPRIGLALGGGGALALSEIGVLRWFEEHHIPVDEVAGTSMGCMVSALYSTGRTPEELTGVMNDKVFTSVFSLSQTYTSKSFRRREDSRELPNAITIGLKHGVSFRNAVLLDQGLNSFLDRQFLRYDDQVDFNALPIPLRCVSTDLNDGVPVTFARGSIPDAIRASVSLPGVYKPFEMDGHEYVDGGVLDNLPTSSVKAMDADVILAVSLPLSPLDKGGLDSILGVLQRSFSVAIEGAEREQRKMANVVMMPDVSGYTAADYLKTAGLAKRGYAAAEANKDALLKYAVSDADWQEYLVHRRSLRRGPAAPVLRVRVKAPNASATLAVQRLFMPLVNQPVDTRKIETLLDQVRADGRYDADYTVGYETEAEFRAQQSGAGLGKKGTVDVPVATSTSQLPAKDQDSLKAELNQQPNAAPQSANGQRAGAPVPNPNAPSTGGQPGLTAAVADAPDQKGLAATQRVTNESLADVADRPIILVTVADKKTGPPFLELGANVRAQTTAVTRATLQAIVLDQDLGGYGNELRTSVRVGYETAIDTEFIHPFNAVSSPGFNYFVAPHGQVLRQPEQIYSNQVRLADRLLQRFGVGGDIGVSNQRTQELRAGYDFTNIRWDLLVGQDNAATFYGNSQRARVRYAYDDQDRALIPQYGVRFVTEAAYLFDAVGSHNAPQITAEGTYAHRFRLPGEAKTFMPKKSAPDDVVEAKPNQGKEIFAMAVDSGTMFHRSVAQPFLYTLGGPVRLSASAIDEYRGTDYWLVEPGLLRRIAQLPQPLGQSIYVGLVYEAGQMYAPGQRTITRQDVFLGLAAETPLGVITFGPAIGDHNERKFVFTLGRLF